MIIGDPMIRTRTITNGQPEGNALTFRCFSENFGGNTAAPGGGQDTVTMPKGACRGGIRTNIYFPSYVFFSYSLYICMWLSFTRSSPFDSARYNTRSTM